MNNLDDAFGDSLFESMNKARKSRGMKPLTKEKYFKNREKLNKKIKELEDKMKYCKKNGHSYNPSSEHISSGAYETIAYGLCTNCDLSYKRKLTSEELKKFNDLMNIPMTI